jgi:hypothetical protein
MRRNLLSIFYFLFLCAFPGPCTTFDDANPQEDASTDADNNHDKESDAVTGLDAFTGLDTVTGLDAATETQERDSAPDRSPDIGQDDERFRKAAVVCSRSFDCPGLQDAVLASVGFPLSNKNYGLCLHWASNPFGVGPSGYHQAQIDMLECIASAADCEGALACTFVRPLEIDDPLCEGYPQGPRCDESANAVIECPGQWRRCDSPLYSNKARCQQGVDLLGAPIARCVIDTQDTQCRAGLGTGYCNDNRAINCDIDLNLTSVIDCSVTGRTCIAQATGATCISAVGNLQCVFTAFPGTYAAEVLRAGSSACVPDSNTVAVCDGEQFATFDCGATDERQCQDQDYPPWAWCAPAHAACTPTTIGGEAAICDDDRLVACVEGHTVKVDCGQFEMRCEPGSLTRSAYCAL